ncbi:MAG TPA: helix-turn-helix domain-containing protein [Verrucomicrobiae bacterium]|nr:helix-turn-helix domain-containing protein [Verrucomicrobiae bacterium]
MNANEQVATRAEASPGLEEGPEKERLAYTLLEVADMIGVDYLSVYRLIQRKKLKACRALRGKFLVTRTELLRMLNKE